MVDSLLLALLCVGTLISSSSLAATPDIGCLLVDEALKDIQLVVFLQLLDHGAGLFVANESLSLLFNVFIGNILERHAPQ